jgi:hypothetical protein
VRRPEGCILDKWEVFALTNIHAPPAEGNFRDKSGNTMNHLVIDDYNTHMGYVDKSDEMSTSYGVSKRT